MRNNKGRQEYGIILNNSELRANVADSKRLLQGVGDSAVAEGARVDSSYKKLASTIASIGAGIGIGVMAKELYSFANAFDKSMKEVSTISQTVTGDFDGFKNKVLEMTTQIPVGADEAAKALYQIVSAGHDGAAGMQVLEVAAKAAIGGVTQTVTAADAITTVLNAYKKDASEAGGISDQLFTTVRLGKTTFGELGQSISQAVPIAASFGIETEQVLAAVATLTKSGVPTAQAMTQIRASITAASKALGDGYFQTHTFQEGLVEIANRAGGSESKLRELVPEIEAVNGVLGLTGINAKTAASDLAELGNSAGATEQAFVKMNDHADAQLTILKNTILKKFHDVGQGATDMVGGFAELLNGDGVFNDKAIDDVIASLVVLIATVGMYKASMMASNAIQRVSTNVQYAAEIAELQRLLPAKQASADADIHQAFAKGRITEATAERLIAIRAEVAAELNALQVKAQVAHADMLAAMEGDNAAKKRVENAAALVAQKEQELRWSNQMGDAQKIETAEQALNNAKLEERVAISASRSTAAQLETTQINAAATATAVDTMQTNVNSAATRSATTAKNLFTAATARLTKAFHSLKLAFASNPIGLLLTGVTMAISLFSMFGNSTKAAAESLSGIEKASKKAAEEFDDQRSKVEALQSVMNNSKVAYDERKRALTELKTLIPQYNGELNKEGQIINNNTEAITRYLTQLEKQIKMKAAQEELEIAYRNKRKIEKEVQQKEKADVNAKAEVSRSMSTPGFGDAGIEYQRHVLNAAKNTGGALIKAKNDLQQANIEIKALNEEIANASTLDINNKPAPKPTLDPDKKDAKGKKEQKDYSDEKISAMLELERMKIDLLKDGREKELAQIEQTKNEKLAAIQKEQQEIAAEIAKGGLTATQKTAKTERSAVLKEQEVVINQQATQDSAVVDEKYNKEIAQKEKELTDVLLSEAQRRNDALKTKYAEMREWSDEAFEKGSQEHTAFNLKINTAEAKEQLDTLTADYQTYADQRKEIEEKFNANIKALEAKNTDGKLDGNIKEAKKQRDAALKELKFDEAKDGVDLSKLFGNLDNMALPSMKELRGKVKAWIESAGKDMKPEDLKAVSDAFNNLDLKIADKDPFAVMKTAAEDYKKSVTTVKDAQIAYNDSLAKNGKESDATREAEEALTAAQNARAAAVAKSTESLQSAAQKGSQIIGIAKDIMGILGDLNIEVPEQISVAIDGMGQMFDGLSGINLMEPLSVISGTVKALGGLLKTISSLFGFNNDEVFKEFEIRQKAAAEAEFIAQMEINALYRDRYEWAQKIGESTVDYIKRQGEELKRQAGANEKDQDDLMAKLLGTQFKAGEHVENTGLFGWGRKIVEDWVSLAGKSWEEIEMLAEKGALSEEGQKYYEALKKAREEGEDLAARQEEYLENVRELVTGSTYQGIVDGIVEGFKAGKRSAADFAQSFDDLMQAAVLSAIELMANAEMRDWYENFAKMGEDGYTEEEIAQARKDYLERMKRLDEKSLALEEATGVTIGSTDDREASKRGIATASQESVDENNGRLTTIQSHTFEINENARLLVAEVASVRESLTYFRDNAASQLLALHGIRDNTAPIGEMRDEMKAMRQGIEDIKDKGVMMRK